MRCVAVRRRAFGPRLDNAGQGIGSCFLGSAPDVGGMPVLFWTSVLVLGLALDTVDGCVVESDTALEALEPCGLVSSQVSHSSLSIEARGDAVAGADLGLPVLPGFLTGVARCVTGEPNSVKNDGSVDSGAETTAVAVDALVSFGRVGERLFVSADVLVGDDEPRDEAWESEVLLRRCIDGRRF